MSTAALEKEVGEILGHQVGVYDLTKKQAGAVIEHLLAATGSKRS